MISFFFIGIDRDDSGRLVDGLLRTSKKHVEESQIRQPQRLHISTICFRETGVPGVYGTRVDTVPVLYLFVREPPAKEKKPWYKRKSYKKINPLISYPNFSA